MIVTSKVCIVVVNYLGHEDTIECLESILKSSYSNFQIVIVDNSVNPDSLNFIRAWATGENTQPIPTRFPEIVFPLSAKPISHRFFSEKEFEVLDRAAEEKILLVQAENNSGFAGGNNIGIDYFLKTSFDFVWLLNNDTVIQNNTLQNFVKFALKSQDSTGIIGGKLFDYYNRDKLQAVGGRYFKWFGKVKEIGNGQRDSGQWDRSDFKFDYVIGASMFVTRSFVHSVGKMTEDYFLYFEELDWAIRGERNQWKLKFCPGAIVFHKLGASTGSGKNEISELSDFYSVRNRLQIAKRYFPITFLTLYPSFILFVFNRIRLRKFDRLPLLLKLIFNPDQKYTKIRTP